MEEKHKTLRHLIGKPVALSVHLPSTFNTPDPVDARVIAFGTIHSVAPVWTADSETITLTIANIDGVLVNYVDADVLSHSTELELRNFIDKFYSLIDIGTIDDVPPEGTFEEVS